jgi:hypothetical protein
VRSGRIATVAGGAGLLLATLVAGCAPKEAPPAPEPTVLPPHFGPPPAATCKAPEVQLKEGGTTAATITLVNDGGYCALTLTAPSGGPYDAGLEPVPPRHGRAVIIRYNGHTSVEYTPDRGFAGTDSFTARLIVRGRPGYTTLNVTANVSR